MKKQRTWDVDYISFRSREQRVKYMYHRFEAYVKGPLLDVGCDRPVLPDLVPGMDYTGVDFSGNPDVKLDLERVERLPFENNAFSCVVCADTLEHMDNLHCIFDELVRTAAQYVVLSLPNNWCNARRAVERGKGSIGHYGLPASPPEDRHKWFFGLSEAADFIDHMADRHSLSVQERVVNEKPRPTVFRLVRRLRYPVFERYANRYAHTMWAVLEE